MVVVAPFACVGSHTEPFHSFPFSLSLPQPLVFLPSL
ncbi:hypothetical protein MUK42_04209 [Musa troglodytarum]|uniref:Uncharacterized protein n=1 Tax=Musa troglodytarum TaxID=320322 RepID=A0A9E7KE81_9LILI|nr:hypothetical protein MUK42_04209 [Musa troglodytarum]